MSKRGAMFPTSLWSDKAFVKLSPSEQLLFVRLWLSPDLSSCGHHALQMSLWGRGFTPQATESNMRQVVAGLEGSDWIVADFDTEEVLLIPFIRLDASKQPQIYASACRTIQAVRSPLLRQRAWQQVQKLGEPKIKDSPRLTVEKLDRMQKSVNAAYKDLWDFMFEDEHGDGGGR